MAEHGRTAVVEAARVAVEAWRAKQGPSPEMAFDVDAFERECAQRLADLAAPSLRPVFNLTGTVLHTNLGRAVMAQEAIDAVVAVMRGASNLEFDLRSGTRGDRDDHLEALLRELTGAEAATVVNNNAAAVLLMLAALAEKREVLVSRGELVEIGGAFRIPDIMKRAGCKLVEVGTTNRTHLHDFASAIGPKTAMVMKVHTSNYAIQGFTHSVPAGELAALCRERGLVFAEDLGSGSLVDLTRFGLPAEPTPAQSVMSGVHVLSFSGDKLLGGPQAGLIVGEKSLIAKIKKCPLKRSLRLDKMTIAALEATLRLYRDPDRLAQRLPALRWLSRPVNAIQAQAERMLPLVQAALGAAARVQVRAAMSQIGSGSLPIDRLPSACLAFAAPASDKKPGRFAQAMAERLRALPTPVIGRIEAGELLLDLRCLDEAQTEAAFLNQLAALRAID